MTKLRYGQEMLLVYKINQRGIIKKRNTVELRFCALHFKSLPEAFIPSGPMMTKLRSGQGKRDDADDDDDAADQSNTYMSPSQPKWWVSFRSEFFLA